MRCAACVDLGIGEAVDVVNLVYAKFPSIF
jgi:hypothetical protein